MQTLEDVIQPSTTAGEDVNVDMGLSTRTDEFNDDPRCGIHAMTSPTKRK